jgi:hypothetical protein
MFKRAPKMRAYDAALMDSICEELGAGASLIDITTRRRISRASVLSWVRDIPEAANKYTDARADQADAHADRILALADKLEKNLIDPNAARVILDAMKWSAAKLRPKVYGDRLDVAIESRAELLVLDYGRSGAPRPLLAPSQRMPLITSGDVQDAEIIEAAQPLITERKRIPKRERMKTWSAQRRAKYEANRAKHAALRAALRAQTKAAKAERRPTKRRPTKRRPTKR